MTSLDAFLPHLQPWLLSAPEPVSKAALLRAAREFCERTHVIQATLGPFDATAGQADFTLVLPSDTELVCVKRAWWGTDELSMLGPEDVGTPHAYTALVAGSTRAPGRPKAATLTASSVLTVLPPTDSVGTRMLTARAAIRPTLAATTVTDELFTDWMEAVVAKAVLLLAAVPGAQLVSAAGATAAGVTYSQQVARASVESRRGRHQKALTVRGVPFA